MLSGRDSLQAGRICLGRFALHGDEKKMTVIKMRTFRTVREFAEKLLGLFRGPTFISALLGVDRRLREKLFLTVTLVNNCYS